MLTFDNGVTLYEDGDTLPDLPMEIGELFADFETGSGDPKLTSLNPWHHCYPLGFGMTWDDRPGALYVEWGEKGKRFFQDALVRSRRWVNHHVKYDAHVGTNAGAPLPKRLELWCTLNGSKLVDSDRMHRTLDALAFDWVREDIRGYEERLQPYLVNNKDYSAIPLDLIAEYGGQDVLTNRRIYRYEIANIPEESRRVLDTEVKLTRLLYKMEQVGVRVDPDHLDKLSYALLRSLVSLEERMCTMLGRSFKASSNEDCYEVLCLQHGLPVLAWTNTDDRSPDAVHNPSFDKHALKAYKQYPNAPVELIGLMLEYRQQAVLLNTFVDPYRALHVDGILHMHHNQCVRTGRMSCSEPNMQQLPKWAKTLILAREGNCFMSNDASQIEFRTIVHYIQDDDCIAAYQANPDTDFHVWVAEMCGVKRKPAKTINFSIGFGCGKAKTIKQFTDNEDVIAEARDAVSHLPKEQQREAFRAYITNRGESVYEKYHGTLPGIKTTSRHAARVAYSRGYVRNLFGRRRHLPRARSHIAFNTLNQSTAADIVKERMIALDEAYEGTGIRVALQVHDEITSEGPTAALTDPRTQRDVIDILEHPSIPLRVPVRFTIGTGEAHWKAASDASDGRTIQYERPTEPHFSHLR